VIVADIQVIPRWYSGDNFWFWYYI